MNFETNDEGNNWADKSLSQIIGEILSLAFGCLACGYVVCKTLTMFDITHSTTIPTIVGLIVFVYYIAKTLKKANK